jgi:prepilin-type N-terminal cleavage/methylation domain-containing protein
MRPVRSSRRAAGFTLIEALVVLAILSVLLMLGLPELLRVVHRSKLEGMAQGVSGLMRIARYEAVKQNVNTRVIVDYDGNEVFATIVDGLGDPTVRLGGQPLPAQIDFWAWNEQPRQASAIDGFTPTPTGGWVEFRPNGAASKLGGIRLADGRNFMEVAVATEATGRIELRKAEPDPKTSVVDYRVNGEREYSWIWK